MSEIKEYFQSLVKAGTIPQEPMNYDAATLKIYIDHLEAENAALREKVSVVKRALREFAVQCGCNKCPFFGRCNISPDAKGDYQSCFDMYLSIVEKELEEERKDENN